MFFNIVGRINHVEIIAAGSAVRERKRLWKAYGKGRWRKLKGTAEIEFSDGTICEAGKFTGTKLMGLARKNTKSSGSSSDAKRSELRFVLCVQNKGYPASLELRKVYQVIVDQSASLRNQIRIIDESGEDYLYPQEYFVPIKLPQAAERIVLRTI